MKPILIGLSGPASSGKTTTLNRLKEAFPDFHYIEEMARDGGFDLKANHKDPEIMISFQQGVFDALELALSVAPETPIIITDRTPWDIFNYSHLYGVLTPYMAEKTMALLGSWDIIFNFKAGPWKEDGFRFCPNRALEVQLFQCGPPAPMKRVVPVDLDNAYGSIVSWIELLSRPWERAA